MPIKSANKQNATAKIASEYAWITAPAPRGEAYLEIRISRKLLIAIIASLLVHALALYLVNRQHLELDMRPVADNTLSVQLEPLTPKSPISEHKAQPPATPKRHTQKPVTSTPHPQKVITQSASATTQTPFTIPVPTPTPAPAPNAAPTDMASYINAVRARRAAESGDTGDSAAPPPSADDIRMANIKRNLQPQGGGGIFQIKRMGSRTGTFLFRGWGNTYTSPLRESITVEADANTDVEHAMIRKMISIIRDRHNGDFTWESYRLNRTVTLSARLADNAGLEDFLMNEFFGAARRPSEQ